MNRRGWIQRVGLGVVAIACSTKLWAVEKIQRLDSEWRRLLTPEQYYILRDEGTEPAGSSPLDKEYRQGEYRCAGCDLLLFTSTMKYDSGTGWPSFLR